MQGTSLSISREFSKESFLKRSNRSLPIAIPKDFELETKDRVIFGLCNYDDIDKYFNELCQESKTTISAVKKVVNFTQCSAGRKMLSPKATASKNNIQITSTSSLGHIALKSQVSSKRSPK